MFGKKVIIVEAKKYLFFVWKLQRYSVLVTPKIVAVDFVFYRKTIFTAGISRICDVFTIFAKEQRQHFPLSLDTYKKAKGQISPSPCEFHFPVVSLTA